MQQSVLIRDCVEVLLFSGAIGNEQSIWKFIRQLSAESSNLSIREAVEISRRVPPPRRRLTQWIELTLISHSIIDILELCIANQSIVQQYYHTDSILASPKHIQTVVNSLKQYSQLSFEFPPDLDSITDQLCEAIEISLSIGMLKHSTLWSFIRKVSSRVQHESLLSTEHRALASSRSETQQLENWLRISLTEHTLASFIQILVQQKDIIQEFYDSSALLLDEKCTDRLLQSLDFLTALGPKFKGNAVSRSKSKGKGYKSRVITELLSSPSEKTSSFSSRRSLSVSETYDAMDDLLDEEKLDQVSSPSSNVVENYFTVDEYRSPKATDRILGHGECITLTLNPVIKDTTKTLLLRQNSTCWGCPTNLTTGFFYSNYRFCYYTGHLYCTDCHHNYEFVIPGYLVHFQDPQLYPLCDLAYNFLRHMYKYPILSLSLFPDQYLATNESVAQLVALHHRAFALRDYVLSCRSRDTLLSLMGWRAYLLEDNDMFSLNDLQLVVEGSGIPIISNLLAKLERHVSRDCVQCSAQGFVCEFCKDPQTLFRFTEDTVSCSACHNLYHQRCKKDQPCPKCLQEKHRKSIAESTE